jgi:uncharacterized membrane protein
MNSGALIQEEVNARCNGAAEGAGQSVEPGGGFLERGVLRRLDLFALAVVLAGFAIRIFVATRAYLNPDEALHYLLVNQRSLRLAYQASLTNAHPPLIFLTLYFWRFLGRSELMLRLPSVLAGTAFCWVAFKWMSNVFGKAAGLIGLILCTFSPAMISLSAEVRAYALLLFCMASSLYFLERALTNKSVREMWGFSACLYLSILSHYSAVFSTAALGVYVLARISDSRLPRKVVAAWAEGQAGALAIYAVLYVTHVSKLKNSIALWSTGFGTTYFHRDTTGLFTFTWENTLNIFLFLFAQRAVAWAILLSFLAGAALLFARDLVARQDNSRLNRAGILLLLPVLAVWGASIAGIYPYVGSRHTVFLAPFVIAGASYLLAVVTRERLWAGVVLSILLVSFSAAAEKPIDPDVSKEAHTPAEMAETVRYMQQSIPKGDLILVDYQSSLPMTYYFCGPREIIPMETFAHYYFEFHCNGYPIVSVHAWKLIAQSFGPQFEKMARAYNLKPGERVWVYQTGWGVDLGTELARHEASFRCLVPKKFGGAVTVTPFVVGPDFLPESPNPSC